MTHSDMVKQRVSDTINQYMAEQDISQDEVAKRLNVHQTAVSAYLQKKTMPRADVFLRMVKVLNLDPALLIPTDNSEAITS